MAKSISAGSPRNVLFIGNSFTARNDLPGMISGMAAGRGNAMRFDLISAGGASLRGHWNAGAAARAINDGKYDTVVLQEQSTLPVKNAKRMHENVRLFDEAIRAARAKTMLYMTWARRNAPETQAAITTAYRDIGKELGATVVPVGTAWQSFYQAHSQPELFDRDQSHPTPAGSYLAACVFLAALFGDSPVGLDYQVAGLETRDKTALQKAAWRAWRSKK